MRQLKPITLWDMVVGFWNHGPWTDPNFWTMPWIEGVGNEVTLFFASVLVICIGFLAWLSTKINNRPLNRTVIVVHSRRARSSTTHTTYLVEPTSLTSPDDDSTVEQTEENEADTAPQIESTGEREDLNSLIGDTSSATGSTANITTNGTGGTDEESEHLEIHSTQLSTDESSSAQVNSIHLEQRIPCSVQKSEPPTADEEDHPKENEGSTTEPDLDPGNIRIRLKYVTDEQRLVQGRLQESLGEFKVRNFVTELSAQKLVRLIFNGHILQRDNETLQEHGLFDNCVVHCLIHQRQTSSETAANQNATNNNDVNPNRDWDLGTLLFVLITLLISFAWYCRFQYGQFFNITTTVVLLGLSGVFCVSLLGLYFPDPEVIRN